RRDGALAAADGLPRGASRGHGSTAPRPHAHGRVGSAASWVRTRTTADQGAGGRRAIAASTAAPRASTTSWNRPPGGAGSAPQGGDPGPLGRILVRGAARLGEHPRAGTRPAPTER